MKKLILVLLSLYVVPGFAQLKAYDKKISGGGTLKFYGDPNMTTEQYSGQAYDRKPDPANVQGFLPLTSAQLSKVTVDDVLAMTQEEMDQLYFRLYAGKIIPGDYRGRATMKGSLTTAIKNFLFRKINGVQILNKVMCKEKDGFACFMDIAWDGKRISAQNPENGNYEIRTAVQPVISTALKVTMASGIKKISPGNLLVQSLRPFDGKERHMIFPGHVYCGQSMIDHRRESIVADYAWGSDFSPFVEGIDDIFGRKFLNVREEFRMIRPGLYLGRVYAQKIFLFNVVIQNLDAAVENSGDWSEGTCFNGRETR